MNVLVLLG